VKYTRDHIGAYEGELVVEEEKPTSPREDTTNDTRPEKNSSICKHTPSIQHPYVWPIWFSYHASFSG